MWLKFTKSIMILVFLSICLSVTGCIDEPKIDPVKRPFSVTRLGNFSSNIASMTVAIYAIDGGVQNFTIQQNTITSYFDVPSGKRKVVVTNSANGDVLYNKDIEFISYEESSVYFGGYFSKSDLENTFSPYYQAEGDTYILEQPKDGKSDVYFADMSSDIVTGNGPELAKKFQIAAVLTPSGKADTTINFTRSAALEFGKLTGAEIPAGAIKVAVVNNADATDTLAIYNGNIDAGFRYYFYLNLTGHAPKLVLVPDKQTVLPVRQK